MFGPRDAVVLEPLVERRDARLADPALHQLADRVVDHRRRDAGLQAEAVGEVRGDVVLAAGDVDLDTSVALRNGMTPGSSRWTRAPRERKSSSPSGRIRMAWVIARRFLLVVAVDDVHSGRLALGPYGRIVRLTDKHARS